MIIALVSEINGYVCGNKDSTLGRAQKPCQTETCPLSGPSHMIREHDWSRKAGVCPYFSSLTPSGLARHTRGHPGSQGKADIINLTAASFPGTMMLKHSAWCLPSGVQGTRLIWVDNHTLPYVLFKITTRREVDS